jgi:hypothetical protein
VTSPVNLLDCHRRSRIISRKLSACIGAPGPHDFAVRKKCRSSVGTIASTAFPLHVRDDAYVPLVGAERATVNTISENKKWKSFCRRDWTAQISLKVLAKIDFARNDFFRPFPPSKLSGGSKIELICPTPNGQVGEVGTCTHDQVCSAAKSGAKTRAAQKAEVLMSTQWARNERFHVVGMSP